MRRGKTTVPARIAQRLTEIALKHRGRRRFRGDFTTWSPARDAEHSLAVRIFPDHLRPFAIGLDQGYHGDVAQQNFQTRRRRARNTRRLCL